MILIKLLCTVLIRLNVYNIFIGAGLHDVSYTPGISKGSFTATLPGTVDAEPSVDSSISLDKSWAFYNFIGGGQTGVSFPHTVNNPNKAIVTIHGRTSEVSSIFFM